MKSDISIFHGDAAEGQAKLLASTICPLITALAAAVIRPMTAEDISFYIQLQPASSKPWSQ